MRTPTTIMLMAAATATMLTACGSNDSAFTDEQLDDARQAMEAFDNADRRIEETRYWETLRPDMQADGRTIELDYALRVCDLLREGATTDEIVADIEPYDPETFPRTVNQIETTMCEL